MSSRAAGDDKASRSQRRDRCTLEGPLEATPQRPHAFVCPSGHAPRDQVVSARFRLDRACAAVWTHVTDAGAYRVTVCAGHVALHRQVPGEPDDTIEFRKLDDPLRPGEWHRLEISTPDGGLAITLDGRPAFDRTARYTPGTVVLGAVTAPGTRKTTGTVTFDDVSVTAAD
jgi:hypothetical protein